MFWKDFEYKIYEIVIYTKGQMMTQYKINKKNESGRSMVEMVGVVAVMSLITVGAFVLIRNGMQTQKISQVSDEIEILAANVRALTSESDNFQSLPSLEDIFEDEELLKGNILANRILKKNPGDQTVIGGEYLVVKADDNGTKFAVIIDGVEDAYCRSMARRSYSGGDGTAVCQDGDSGKMLKITFTK